MELLQGCVDNGSRWPTSHRTWSAGYFWGRNHYWGTQKTASFYIYSGLVFAAPKKKEKTVRNNMHLPLVERPLNDLDDCFQRQLMSWQHLAHKFEEKGEKLFKLRPKHHSIHHMSSQALKTKVNPRKVMSCFPDETFLGYLKRVAIRCHAAGVLTRTYQRYLMFLGFRGRDGRKSRKDFPGESHRRHLWGTKKTWVSELVRRKPWCEWMDLV